MNDSFEQALDRCLGRVTAGERVETCLADYPQHAARLEPLLRAALTTQEAYSFTPSAEAKQAARQRFEAARERARLSQRAERRGWVGFVLRPFVWAPLAVLIASVITLVGVRPALMPGVLPITPAPSPSGNFAFLVSDEVNAIDDFTSVTLQFSQIGLQDAASGKWLHITPETMSVDLTQLKGAASQQVWRGDIPAGLYRQQFLYVENVTGVLKADGRTVTIKLPSNKLHLTLPFEVSDNTVTAFTFDLTVVNAGKGNDKEKYLLKPVIGESGASSSLDQPSGQGNANGKDNTKPNGSDGNHDERTGPPPQATPPTSDKTKSSKKKA